MRSRKTRYRHVTFRSELEARWAVFFDALHIPWEYEPRGFEFADESSYIPDFWLPGQRCWFEAKPESYTVDEQQKATKLSVETATNVFVGIGVPQLSADRPNGQLTRLSPLARTLSGYQFATCERSGAVGITLEGELQELYCSTHHHQTGEKGHNTARIFTAVVISRLAYFH